jgi:hypothetical protein
MPRETADTKAARYLAETRGGTSCPQSGLAKTPGETLAKPWRLWLTLGPPLVVLDACSRCGCRGPITADAELCATCAEAVPWPSASGEVMAKSWRALGCSRRSPIPTAGVGDAARVRAPGHPSGGGEAPHRCAPPA